MNVTNNPFSEEEFNVFQQLLAPLDERQLAWVAGYLAALSVRAPGDRTSLPEEHPDSNGTLQSTPAKKLTILYGSRTGNGANLAKIALRMAVEQGVEATLKNMEDYPVKSLEQEECLLVIVSTHGDGEPPFQAKTVYDFLHGKRAPGLSRLEYAVFALGDSSYFHFCKTGKEFDSRLAELGARRLRPVQLSDVDIKPEDESWLKEFFGQLKGEPAAAPVRQAGFKLAKALKGTAAGSVLKSNALGRSPANPASYNRKNPLQAQVFEKINLHGRGSDRTTLHIELQTEGLTYLPGDSAGIIPVNSEQLTDEVLAVTGLQAGEKVEVNGVQSELREALQRHLEIGKLTPDQIGKLIALIPDEEPVSLSSPDGAVAARSDTKTGLAKLTENPSALQEYLYGRDIVDLLTDFPVKLTAAQLTGLLKPLQPRYYSIASSPNAFPGEVHLTVALVGYEKNGRNKRGTCTGFLSDVTTDDETVPVFIESNPHFRLPDDPSTPIIMIGAGTGIAPYRAFVQERELTPGAGKSWLIFGNRHFETEFLYQTEWQNYLKSGALTRMDVAFSRDGAQPVYVQHRMLENAKELYDWIAMGAQVYICGDMRKMAADVQQALSTILQQEGGLSAGQAQEELDLMQRERRLQLDVY
ncbi:MAG: flavodoxin domain-containing protein [Bacteroidales bacterium]|nr:flavodoxin domain-containing protein [Bacteroidales bacterium]